jgi:tetratricopeptide (TPR) repeat protein
LGLGDVYYNQRQYALAINSYKEGVRLEPNNAEAHYNLGMSYYSLNNRNAALEHYRILQRIDPDRATKLFNAINR